jgi:hypothetical protein
LLIEQAMLSALGKAEREQLAQLLAKLLAYLERPHLLAIEFRMTLLGEIEPKRPQHYRRHDCIDPALRKKMATGASLAQSSR